MNLPESWTDRFPALEPLEEQWGAVPRVALASWLLFFALFLYQARQGEGILLMMDLVFIPVHEGGHLLFRMFGEFVSVAGGTFLQFFAPAALALWFIFHRQIQGTAFCAFFFFEQCLPTARYMADARAQELPLLTVGDADYVIHDWNYLFGKLGVLDHDIQIAGFVRLIGWAGMIGTMAWMTWRSLRANPTSATRRY